MTDAQALIALAERVEAAVGPDRGLDAAIFRAIDAPLPASFGPMSLDLQWSEDGAEATVAVGDMRVRFTPPAYTRSHDAAMTLVSEGAVFISDNFDNNRVGFRSTAGVFVNDIWVDCTGATTPALAITAACLRAHAAKLENGK